MTYVEGEKEYVLSECGGVSSFDFGGRSLGVIKEIKLRISIMKRMK